MDEKFTSFADRVTYYVGTWPVTVISLVIVFIWLGFGPVAHFSDSWQLWINSPTTVVELFLGFFTLAAANRVERRTHDLLEEIKRHAQEDVRTTKRVEREITGEE